MKEKFLKVAKVIRLISNTRPILFSTISTEGAPKSRYIGAYVIRDSGSIYLVSPSNSAKMEEIRRESRAQIIFSSESCHKVLTLSGNAEVVEDISVRKEIYAEKSSLKMYPEFSDHFGVIHFMPDYGEYLDIDISDSPTVIL